MSASARLYLAVAVGSSLGAVARYSVWLAGEALLRTPFPWATLVVNVLGSLAIGFYATLTGPDGRVFASPAARQFVIAGILGGLTTFSVFSLETVLLAAEGLTGLAAGYVIASLATWVPAAWAGHALARHLNRLR